MLTALFSVKMSVSVEPEAPAYEIRREFRELVSICRLLSIKLNYFDKALNTDNALFDVVKRTASEKNEFPKY